MCTGNRSRKGLSTCIMVQGMLTSDVNLFAIDDRHNYRPRTCYDPTLGSDGAYQPF